MDAAAKAALAVIRKCLAADRYRTTAHFRLRMARRGLLWSDLLTVFDVPTAVREGGHEKLGRPKWLVAGFATDRLPVEIACVLDTDPDGETTILITIYFLS
jgi:hypothetical protein